MNKIGIICEYNPFHNGHLYHLKQIKKMYSDSLIILVLSTSFTERGEVSLLTKEEKTNIALKYGIDLVIELPFIYATQSADIFAKGSIAILKKLQVDYLVFGSEENNVDKLIELANIQLNNSFYDELVKAYLNDGINYPTAMSKALYDISDIEINSPNDLLGLSYIKEIIIQDANITPITIKRTNDYHSKDTNSNIISASAIRELLDKNKDIKKYVPDITYKYLKEKKNIDYFPYLKYRILSNENISNYQTVDEGLDNRIIKYINSCNTKEEFIKKIKTKRYTYNKLSRMCIHILNSLTKEEALDQELKYIRIIGFNDKGQNYLKQIKKEIDIPLITNIKKKDEELLKLDIRSEKIYSLITNTDINSYKNPPIKK